MVPVVVAHMLLHLLANLQEKSLVAQHPYTTTRMHSSVLVWSNCMLFFGLLPLYTLLGVDILRRGWKTCSRMKVLINLVAFYLCRFQRYALVGPWRHEPDIKEKPRAPKPAAFPFNGSSSSSSSSSAPHNNNVQDSEIVVSDGELSVDSDYTSDLVEANKVHVERAKRRRVKAPCLQPLVLTRRQQAIAKCYCLVQETFVIYLSINGFMCCSLVGKEGAREVGGKAGPRE